MAGFTWGYSNSTPVGVGFHRQNFLKHKSPILNRLQYSFGGWLDSTHPKLCVWTPHL